MPYDIMQIEDDTKIWDFYQSAAKSEGLSLMQVASLSALEMALQQDSAKAFLVDGRFPRQSGGEVLDLAEEAIAVIRRAYPQAFIILHANVHNAEQIASRSNVEYIGKERSLSEIMGAISRKIHAQ